MTSLLTRAATSINVYQIGRGQNDDVVQAQWDSYALRQWQDSDILWIRSSFPCQAMNGFNGLFYAHQLWEWNYPPNGFGLGLGHSGRKKITGIVSNQAGVPVSGVTVWLFNTSTGLLVDTQTSQGDGSYRAGDPNAVQCFAVGYLTGSPDTVGVTIDTLTGT